MHIFFPFVSFFPQLSWVASLKTGERKVFLFNFHIVSILWSIIFVLELLSYCIFVLLCMHRTVCDSMHYDLQISQRRELNNSTVSCARLLFFWWVEFVVKGPSDRQWYIFSALVHPVKRSITSHAVCIGRPCCQWMLHLNPGRLGHFENILACMLLQSFLLPLGGSWCCRTGTDSQFLVTALPEVFSLLCQKYLVCFARSI